MPAMNTKVVYQIGKETTPQDKPPFQAFIYWLSEGKLLRTEYYSEQELAIEIGRLRETPLDDTSLLKILEDALSALRKSNSTGG